MFRIGLLATALIAIDALDANIGVNAPKLVAIASTIAHSVDALIINCELVRATELVSGINRVYLMSQANIISKRVSAPSLASTLCAIGLAYDSILVISTTYWHDIISRAAATLNKPLISNVSALPSCGEFVRSIYAGKLLQRVECKYSKPWLLSVDVSNFKAGAAPAASAKTSNIHHEIKNSLSVLKRELSKNAGSRSLCDAKIVIAGGKAFKSAEMFNKYLLPLATKLRAAVGATRAAVDAGLASADCQIGQTGKIIAPKLYIAFGISGSAHHMIGVKDANIILAVNTDASAPITKLANYTIVADMFELIPKLLSYLPIQTQKTL
ncbi:MAG: electron transfer flavoprotein subunit alpha/FixB family protein [Candidatus Hodgkinia cicadicola]